MFVARSSLFVAVALLALSTITEAAQVCKPYEIGTTRHPAFPVPVTDTYLEPHQPVYEYIIKRGSCPFGSFHVGTWLEACDEGIAPIVHFEDLNHATITRPNPVATGVVHGEIFCQNKQWGAKPSLSAIVSAKTSPFGGASAADLPRVEVSARQ